VRVGRNLMAATNQLCQDIASIPFLWVLPLTLYLLTFIVCFESDRWFDRRITSIILLIAFVIVCILLVTQGPSPI